MASYDGSIMIETKVDSSGVQKGIGSINKQAKTMKTSFAGIGKAVAAAFAVKVLVDFGKQAVSLASDLQEVQNVVDVAFGDMADKVEEFAKTSIETMGISELTAKRTASTYMAMGKGMGLAAQDAFNMSLGLTQLSADMASFYNISQERADIALKAVYTGETEVLKQYGIVMTEVNLQQYALSQGITKSLDSMNQQEKTMLRYNYVLQQTQLAQGDFARTSDSWSNQTRILSENWKQFMTIVGNGLVQVLTPLVIVLNKVMSALIGFANAIASVFGGQKLEMQETEKAISGAVENQKDLTNETKKTNKEAQKMTASFDEIQKLQGQTAEASGAGGGISGGASGFEVPEFEIKGVEETTANIDKIQEKLNVIGDWFRQFETPFQNWVSVDLSSLQNTLQTSFNTIWDGIKNTTSMVFTDLFNTVLPPIITTGLTTILPTITQIGEQMVLTFTTFFTTINGLFQTIWQTGLMPAVEQLTSIWSSAWETIKSFWDTWGAPIFENIRTMIENVGSVLTNIWNTIILPVWENIMENIDWLWTNHLQPLMANFLDFVGTFVNGALEIYNKFITPLVNWFIDTFGGSIANTFNFIVNIISTAIATIADVVSGIITSLKGIIEYIVGIFTGDWERAWEGIKTFYEGLWEAIGGIVKGAVNLIIDFINGMLKALENGVNKVIKMINKLEITNPFTGDEIWSPNVPEVSFPQIPKLAQGAVIPPNKEFMAILGDQKQGVNIETPLATMIEAFKQAQSQQTGELVADITLDIDGEKLYNQQQRIQLRRGTRLVTGGAF